MSQIKLKGISASRGMAHGVAALIPTIKSVVNKRRVKDEDIIQELERFKRSVQKSRIQIEELLDSKSMTADIHAIFEAQLLFLDDPMIVNETQKYIKEKGWNSEWALVDTLESLKKHLHELDNPFMRERVADIIDIENRILSNLTNIFEGDVRIQFLEKLREKAVLIAEEISPSLMLHIPNVAGIATERGGVTGHMAILARNRGIPTLVGIKGLTEQVHEGDDILLDTANGNLIIEPGKRNLSAYHNYMDEKKISDSIDINSTVELNNKDTVSLWVNLDRPEDINDLLVNNIQGIGLFRTEFLYLKNPELFSKPEKQIEIYSSVLEAMNGKPVIFRLIDVGDDKLFDFSFYSTANFFNESATHLRGIRFLLANPDILKNQIGSIITAALKTKSSYNNCRIMLPMVTTLAEIKTCRRMIQDIAAELGNGSGDVGGLSHPMMGIMLETPAACLMADVFSDYSDFFSIGTNDLARSVLVMEREDFSGDESRLFQPAVFRLIKTAIEKAKVDITVCGEMAGINEFIGLLIGLGVRQLSASRSALKQCFRVLQSLNLNDCEILAEKVMNATDCDEVQTLICR